LELFWNKLFVEIVLPFSTLIKVPNKNASKVSNPPWQTGATGMLLNAYLKKQ
jgi:hypothetical protein